MIVVRDSTRQLREELENGDGPLGGAEQAPHVRSLVTALLRNYRLKDSLEAALALSEAAAEGARAHGRTPRPRWRTLV